MATTHVPRLSFTSEGLVLPQESEILAGVMSDINNAFGGGINPALETPQGQLASSTTAIIGAKNSEFAYYVNQVDPSFADGRMQEAIGRIYFIERKPGAPTTVMARCTGLTGVTIPVGARAQSANGQIYLCTQAGTIDTAGFVDLPFACTVNGPLACPAGMLNQIYQAIPGWDSIHNAIDGVVGSHTESRAEFEARRSQSVALNAQGSLPAIYAAVANVDGVIDLYVTENNTNAPQTIGGVVLAPHSIWVAVTGGATEDIARAIWRKKSIGSNYNGNTVFTVEDTDGYVYPHPSYDVRWETPQALPVKFNVQIANHPQLPSDVIAQTKAALIAAFSGMDGGIRARIGSTIFASRFYAPLAAISPLMSILALKLGIDTPDITSLTIPIDKQPILTANDIEVEMI